MAKRPKVTEKTGDEEDSKGKKEVTSSSAPTSKNGSPKPASPKLNEAKSPEKPANTEQLNESNTDKQVFLIQGLWIRNCWYSLITVTFQGISYILSIAIS